MRYLIHKDCAAIYGIVWLAFARELFTLWGDPNSIVDVVPAAILLTFSRASISLTVVSFI